MKHLLIAAVFAVSCASASAGVYKCQSPKGGVTYSDAPCADKPILVPVSAPTSAGPSNAIVAVEESVCAKEITRHVSFRDPSSVMVTAVTRMSPKSLSYGTHRQTARTHALRVNAKNGYGGYTGEQMYLCHVSDDEKTVLLIAPAGT